MDNSLEKDPRLPYYSLQEFLAACGKPSGAIISGQAQADANTDFKLRSQKEILAFITDGGLEKLEFINWKKWENNPRPEKPIMADGYTFMAFSIRGYIAFLKTSTGCWMIKSFHRSRDANSAMEIALRKAGFLPGGSDA